MMADLESLVTVGALLALSSEGSGRYIHEMSTGADESMATSLVWWQAFLMGVAWVCGISTNDMVFSRIRTRAFKEPKGAAFHPIPGAPNFRYNVADIERIVAFFRNPLVEQRFGLKN